MSATIKITKAHKNLLLLLQEKEVNNQKVSEKELIDISGWKRSTLITYLSKGKLLNFLIEVGFGIFEVRNTLGISIDSFARSLSQIKHTNDLGSNCKSDLAKALVNKSKDNMLLALELYNRPSLQNKMDGFVLLFCIAWEHILKAILIEEKGENFIFKSAKSHGKIRETISLRDCLKEKFKSENIIRLNIERIAYYRDQAVHLLMPEIQNLMSRIFQSGIFNYAQIFKEFTGQEFVTDSHAGMISLIGDVRKNITPTVLHTAYGKESGNEILELATELEKEIVERDNVEFAIPINVKLIFAKDEDGASVTLTKADEGIEGLKKAIVIEKPVDRVRTHPYKESIAIQEINKRLYDRYSIQEIQNRLVYINKKTNKHEINNYCFRAIVSKLKWRSGNNIYHYKNLDPEYHYYSDRAIEEFINKVMSESEYLRRARDSYSYDNKSKSSKT